MEQNEIAQMKLDIKNMKLRIRQLEDMIVKLATVPSAEIGPADSSDSPAPQRNYSNFSQGQGGGFKHP